MHDPLGDELKQIESAGQPGSFDPRRPIYIRLDGRGFSKFTAGMNRPFDARMTAAMSHAAIQVISRMHARAGYVQSDEISLILNPGETGELPFAGRPSKILSVFASLATAAFTQAIYDPRFDLGDYASRLPHFDARACQPEDPADIVRMFAWRGQDARRNGVNQIAQSRFSARQLHGLSTAAVRERLSESGVRISDFPASARNGVLLHPVQEERELTLEEIARIPAGSRPPQGQRFTRTRIAAFDDVHPGLVENLDAVLLEGAAPRAAHRPAYT